MGREIRRVPANWQHPKYTAEDAPILNRVGQYCPMHDEDYLTALNRWWEAHRLWETGKHPNQDPRYRYYSQYDGDPPTVHSYRPAWSDDEATWWQVYETVSEGTPVTPAFATAEELVDYLATCGDFWDQQRGDPPWPREAAQKFVTRGWAPTIICTPQTGFVPGHLAP